MDPRIQELIDMTRLKFGLNHYYLQRHSFSRYVNIFNETVYRFGMEWFPNHAIEQEDDGSNPEGTAVIEMNLNTGKFESAIFVMGKTYAKEGVMFANHNVNDIIKWIEQETGLIYGKHFQLHKKEEGELHFNECIDGVAVSPSGKIEVKFNKDGNLTSFANYGQFPSKEMVKEEVYALSFDMIEGLAKEQLKRIEWPSFEQKSLLPVYAVEEIYVTNDGKSTIPFEVMVDERSHLEIDKTIYWDQPINVPFERKKLIGLKMFQQNRLFHVSLHLIHFQYQKQNKRSV